MNIKWKKWAVLALFLSVPFLSGGTMGEGCSKPVVEIPSAPSNLEATRMTYTQIRLFWSDNSSNADSFYVYRKCGDGEYKLVAVTSFLFYTDTNVPKGVKCTYYVTAYNIAGPSEPSNEASA
ncbi:hypothetical protein LCGC14_2614380 [marine sediment metagenome]|uniref:Fibronectin type-III domain-containing protein n=1 Tax=marine sediment metagenome TaxID=412755 RepID=A0A0F9CG12_9ZZZZ